MQKTSPRLVVDVTTCLTQQGAYGFMKMRHFLNEGECIAELRADGYQIWTADLTPESIPIQFSEPMHIPEKVAIVFGREIDGISPRFRQEADKSLYIPLYGTSVTHPLRSHCQALLNR